MLEGIVIKAYSSFYYVQAGANLWECKLRGRFKLEKKQVLAGDHVLIQPGHNRQGVIEEIEPRKNSLTRPPVANVDQAVLVFAVANPNPDLELLDRLLLLAEAGGIDSIICFNKIDLSRAPKMEELASIYRPAGYEVLFTCGVTGDGVAELKEKLNGRISVFAGPSGAGKSTLLNRLSPGRNLKTGDVSQKLGRGRHTTRHVELIPIEEGGLVADTPGFSNLFLPALPKDELDQCFPEFHDYLGQCRFTGCLHHKEPSCAVKRAVEEGKIDRGRYEHYVKFVQELAEQKKYLNKP